MLPTAMSPTPRPPAAKQPYARPVLAIYGDMRALTLNNVSTHMNDTMNGSNTRT